jgi:pSer/pThr/pTyr-binding forkhead associated (FHA) protein
VSRRHAEVLPAADGTWTIADLGSTNGVLVNGHRISGAQLLASGDRMVLGTAEIAFELE